MVPKKSKSKRISCAQRYKTQKKVNEAHRKQRREEKRNPMSAKSKLKKDPGIPNLFPFKEKMLHAAIEEKQRAEFEKKQRKIASQNGVALASDTIAPTPKDIETFAAQARLRGEQFDNAFTSIHSSKALQKIFLDRAKSQAATKSDLYGRNKGVQGDDNAMVEEDQEMDGDEMMQDAEDIDEDSAPSGIPLDDYEYTEVTESVATGRRDNSKKAYYKEFKNVVSKADVILEVLDCRDPLGCRARDIEELILNAGSQKKIVLLLNKIDLVPKETVLEWIKYLKNEYPTIAFKASTQNQRHNLGQKNGDLAKMNEKDLSGGESVGADDLIQLLKNYCRSQGMKTSITVGVIGYPNVGKSSVINSLKRSRVCQVGSTPGVTKIAQTIQLDKNLKLLDSPGIIFASTTGSSGVSADEVLLRNCVKVQLVEDPVTPVGAILRKTSQQTIMKVYNVLPYVDANDFLVQLARVSGRLKRGGVPNIEAMARKVLYDWNAGKIPFFTEPPKTHTSHVGAKMMSAAEAAALPAFSR